MPIREENGLRFFAVNLDHPDVIQAVAHEHIFAPIKDRIDADSEIINSTISKILPLALHDNLKNVTQDQQNETDPFWDNGYFSGADARFAYGFAAEFRPRTILEIGSGNSTKFFRKAIRDFKLASRLVSIDPHPRAAISSVADEIVAESALKVDPKIFEKLGSGDILFIDGSHVCLSGTDVPYLFLEIIPRLNDGVLIHIHDIHLPYEYIPIFVERGYSEEYVLGAYLLGNSDMKIIAPIFYLYTSRKISIGGVSFWMRTQL